MKTIFKANLFALIIMVTWIIGNIILGCLFALPYLNDMPTYLKNILINFLLLFLPAIYYTKSNNLSLKKTLRFNNIKLFDLVLILGFAFLIQPFMMFLSSLSSLFFTNNVQQILESQKNTSFILMFISFAITPAFFEEIGTRGILLSGYDDVNIKIAAIVNGLFFGCLHLNLQQFFYAFALGIFFVYIVKATNSIFASMFAHFLINGNQLLMFKLITVTNRQNLQIQNATTNPLTAQLYSLFIALIFTPIAIYFIYLLFKRNNNINIINMKNNKLPSFKTMVPIYLVIIISFGYCLLIK